MPDHASWLTMALAHMRDTLNHNAHHLGESMIGHHHPTWQSFEPLAAALLIVLLILGISLYVKGKLANTDEAVIPDDKLTLRTFMETFLGYFYDLAKSAMGPERAKKYFPIIGGSAVFVFFSNVMALIPGAPIATSSLNITLGCALLVFVLFNFYGIATVGIGKYLKHMWGPSFIVGFLLFPIELISLCARPITLAARLMLNMSIDHLILGIFTGLVAVLVPLPLMMLGCVVIIVQTLVFALLTTIYIAMATEDEEHGH